VTARDMVTDLQSLTKQIEWKLSLQSRNGTCRRATERHLLYGITRHLPPDTSKRVRINPSKAGQYSICSIYYVPWRDWRLSWPTNNTDTSVKAMQCSVQQKRLCNWFLFRQQCNKLHLINGWINVSVTCNLLNL